MIKHIVDGIFGLFKFTIATIGMLVGFIVILCLDIIVLLIVF